MALSRSSQKKEKLKAKRASPPKHRPRSPSSTRDIFAKLPSAARRHRMLRNLTFYSGDDIPGADQCLHKVARCITRKNKKHIYKPNKINSKMSESEACAWGYYNLLIPGQVPREVFTYYDDEENYVGLSLELIENFVPIKKDPLTEEDLDDEEIVKGLARGLVASWIFEEDDCHRLNMAKNGVRIDFDMSLYPILGKIKFKDRLINIRQPVESRFPITPTDILNFPDIQNTDAFYWPTKPQPYIRAPLRDLCNKLFGLHISDNAFTEPENELFKRLKTNKIFIREKYRTMLKYILLPDHALRKIAIDHIREKITTEDEQGRTVKLRDLISAHVIERRNKLRDTLMSIKEFRTFFDEEGPAALVEIKKEINEANETMRKRELDKKRRKPNRDSEKWRSSYIELENAPDSLQAAYDRIKKTVGIMNYNDSSEEEIEELEEPAPIFSTRSSERSASRK